MNLGSYLYLSLNLVSDTNERCPAFVIINYQAQTVFHFAYVSFRNSDLTSNLLLFHTPVLNPL